MELAQKQRSILQRKLSTQGHASSATTSSAAKMAHLATRAAWDSLNLTLIAGRRHAQRAKATDMQALLHDISILVWAENDEGDSAFIGVDPTFLSVIIEVQTIGRVLGRASIGRGPTATDFALASVIFDRILADDAQQELLPQNMRCKRLMTSPHQIETRYGANELYLTSMSFRLGDADLSGKLILGYPQSDRGHPAQIERPVALDCPQLLDLTVNFQAVIARLAMPIGDLANLRVNDAIVLAEPSLDKIEIMTGACAPSFSGVLGKLNGNRAICIRLDGEQVSIPDAQPIYGSKDDPLGDENDDLEKLLDQEWLDAISGHDHSADQNLTGAM